MIIVTGATGKLGSAIVDRLLARLPPAEIGVSVRDVSKAAHLGERGVRVRSGNYSDPASLARAFAGADRVLIISSNDSGADAVQQHRTAIDAARAAGAERVVYTSHQAAAPDSLFRPMPDHAATEAYLAEQGGRFTSLRNGFYASTVPMLIGAAVETGTLAAPADGPVSWTAHDDLAEIAALALLEPDRLGGITAPLTAPDMFDLAAVAELLTELTGRRITRVVVDDDDFAAGMVSRGVPVAQAEFSLGLYRAARRGEFAVTDPALTALLGRPVTPLRDVLRAAAAG